MSNKIKIGISIGDVNGIGLEVILKTLANTVFLITVPLSLWTYKSSFLP